MKAQSGWNKEVINKRKDYFRQGQLLLKVFLGSIRKMTSLVLITKFPTHWFKILLVGEAEIAISLDIKFWFAKVGFSTNGCILSLSLLT